MKPCLDFSSGSYSLMVAPVKWVCYTLRQEENQKLEEDRET